MLKDFLKILQSRYGINQMLEASLVLLPFYPGRSRPVKIIDSKLTGVRVFGEVHLVHCHSLHGIQ